MGTSSRFPFLFLEMPNPNLWPAEGAGPTLNFSKNGHGYPPGLKVAEAVASLRASLLKKDASVETDTRYTY